MVLPDEGLTCPVLSMLAISNPEVMQHFCYWPTYDLSEMKGRMPLIRGHVMSWLETLDDELLTCY